jgi:transposase
MTIESLPVNLSTVARVFRLQPKTLYHWYRNHLSDYLSDKEKEQWPPKHIEHLDMETGELEKQKPLYVFNPENLGDKMSIDDKSLADEGFTIMSNSRSGKIALMIESCKKDEVSTAISLFGSELQKVESISCDMSPTYLSAIKEQMPWAKIVIDKFHVMQYVYDAVSDVRVRIKNELSSSLSKGKEKTELDKEILMKLDLLRRNRYRLLQSPYKWSSEGIEAMENLFRNHEELKNAYFLSQRFKSWYDISHSKETRSKIIESLHAWYEDIKKSKLKEFTSPLKMICKHEKEIINFFISGQTNAKAERLNGQINRFIASNYGIRDKDFVLFRINGYFS